MAFEQKRLVTEAKRAVRAGQLTKAQQLCERAVKQNRRDVDALELLGVLALERGVLDEAASRFRKCVTLRPRETRYQYRLGQVLYDQGRVREAVDKFDSVLRHGPDPSAMLSKAAALERVGAYAEARTTLQPVADEGDMSGPATAVWARLLMHDGELDAAIDVLRRRLDDGGLGARQRQTLLFVLGRVYEKSGDFDAAFLACQEANEIDKPMFDAAAYVDRVDRIIRTFSGSTLAGLSRSTVRSDLPVVIAGMPRSGTTLVEQIIAAHPRAAGAGELIHLPRQIDGLQLELDSYEPYPECLEDMTADQAGRLGKAYINVLRGSVKGASRVADKTLDNFELLGLISLLTPGARVVRCRRDPMDTCLSCYLNHILPERFPWVADLAALAVVYRQHDRLMAHWHEVLELPMHEVAYEQLVGEPEPQIRVLIESCDLPWDDRCLQFHATNRAVMTLSYDQVSRPMYQSSVDRWRRFEKHLGALAEELGK